MLEELSGPVSFSREHGSDVSRQDPYLVCIHVVNGTSGEIKYPQLSESGFCNEGRYLDLESQVSKLTLFEFNFLIDQ